MDLRDLTKNQHFVPQVEQRLNAINTQVKSENQRIYSFSVRDRDLHTVKVDSEKGIKISKNLSLHDLFSFDVLAEEASRYNFEKLFQDYETRIKVNTESILSKIDTHRADIKIEIINIFMFKVLNFIRNPYSIKSALSTFSEFKDKYPTDPVHFKNFERVLNGRKPQSKYLCRQLDITENEYREWLAIIFFMLTPMKEGYSNFFNQLVKRIYENSDLFIQVHIYTYDNETCLLSDRGHNKYEIDKDKMVWEFNLHSKGFIKYGFVNIDTCIPEHISEEIVAYYKSNIKTISTMHMHNDLTQLEIYNQNTIAYCHEKVFSSSSNCYGVGVL